MEFIILIQFGIDIVIVVVFSLLIKRLGGLRLSALGKGLSQYESLVATADEMSGRFESQLAEKRRLIQKLEAELNQKTAQLERLLKRADKLVNTAFSKDAPLSGTENAAAAQQAIVSLAQKGHTPEEIAETLAVPKEEVLLVIDLDRKLNR